MGLSASKRLEKEVIFFQHYNSHSSQIINVGFLHNDASNKLIKIIFNNETRNYSLMSEGKCLSVKSVSALVMFVLFKAPCPCFTILSTVNPLLTTVNSTTVTVQ